MASTDNTSTAESGDIVVHVPPKPKYELLLASVILTASILLIISELSNRRNEEGKYSR